MSGMTSVSLPVNLPAATKNEVVPLFQQHRKLSVRQKKRWLELLLNWEQKNSYAVFDEEGKHALQVKEEGNGLWNLIKRLLLRTQRPFDAVVYDNPIPKPLLHLHRPWRFIFHTLTVSAADGQLIGSIERKWSWIRRIYAINDEHGQQIAELYGPFFRPWTFEVRVQDQALGVLQKRWSGFTKELFTDADNFVLDVEAVQDPKIRLLAFAATVLIDVVHFEKSQHN